MIFALAKLASSRRCGRYATSRHRLRKSCIRDCWTIRKVFESHANIANACADVSYEMDANRRAHLKTTQEVAKYCG
jgi:hypothetical protein